MSLPNDLSSFHKSNAGVLCYHSAVVSLAGFEVPILWTMARRKEGKTAGVAAVQFISEHQEESEAQLLMESWEIVIESGESADSALQLRKNAWLTKMQSRYGR